MNFNNIKMFLLFPLIILITSFKSIFSLKDEYISHCNYNLKRFQNYTYLKETKIFYRECDCFPSLDDFSNITNLNFTEILICSLNCWKKNSTDFLVFANSIKLIIENIIEPNIEAIIVELKLNKTELLILNITKKIVNNNTIINQFAKILKPENNKTIFSDLMIELLIINERKEPINETMSYVYLNKVLKIDGFFKLFQSIYNSSKTDFLELIEIFLSDYYQTVGEVFNMVRYNFSDIIDDIIIFIYRVFENYEERNIVYDLITDFIIKHNSSYDKIKEILKSKPMRILYDKLIFVDDDILETTKHLIFGDDSTFEMFLNISGNKDSLLLGTKLLKNLDNITYLKENVVDFLTSILVINSTMVEPLTEFFFDLMFNLTNKNDSLSIKTFSAFQMFLGDILKSLNYSGYKISPDCLILFNYTYFNRDIEDKRLFFLYFQKFIFDSSRNKGNFLPFDNCMDNNYYIPSSEIYKITPAFIIGLVDEYQQKIKNKNTSYYFKYNYLRGYCFPFGYKNETAESQNIPMCNDSDYEKIFTVLYHFYSNQNDTNITTFSINKSNKSPSALYNFYGVLGILFLGFPILIYIFLLISGKIIINKQNKINEIEDNNKNLKARKKELIEVIENAKSKKIIFPKWYKYLNEFFNIINNGKELFNFTSNHNNYNNFKGLTYIKGLIGICIILTIIGQTFIALFNLPTKVYGIWDFYLMMSSLYYFILYIGYRYCPRILFSCSGYILVYKYLCYIEQEKGLYFLKFMFLQSYKYILLIFFIIIIRYPLYYIVFLMRQEKRPTWEIFKHLIEKDENFFGKFFSFLIYPKGGVDKIKQNFIFYFYIPINEVLFFILGTGLISLGYKFKLRIDIFIFVLVIIIYASKIIFYEILKYRKYGVYTTTDYYLFDYGLNLIHPLFNLNYFLIGMFFGLINYSIQKGITDIYDFEKTNNYRSMLDLSDSKNLNINDDDKEEENDTVKKKFTFSFDETNSKINDLNDDNVSKTDELLLKKSRNNDKLFRNFHSPEKKIKNRRNNDINDINKNDNEKLEKFILEENEKGSEKKEYSEIIKQIPFLIWPIKFSNFHKTFRNKWFINLFIVIAFLLVVFFVLAQSIFTFVKLEADAKDIVKELSFQKIIPDTALNIIFLLDIEIAIFIIQWINFIFYYKEIGLIKNFLNHVYWSFFVKSYFTFILVSVIVILLFFYITETSIKFNFTNIFLYAFIDIILILISTIVIYSCFELPFKKIFKFFLKGKEALNNEEDNEEYEAENNENEEEKLLKD